MKPVIGVAADLRTGSKHAQHAVQEKYLDAATAGAGGLAFVIPAQIDRPNAAFRDNEDFSQTLDLIDALFLTGSASNILPQRYGRTLEDPESPADPARDHVTLRLIQGAQQRGMPILGICRGFQEINVALGGTLHQAVHHVPGLHDHREDEALTLAQQYAPAHEVRFTPGGMLHQLTGLTGTKVNSLHGQGVDELASALLTDAVAPDGLIEAFRGNNPAHFLLGVQWHPEWRFRDNPVSVAIFRGFGNAARAYAAS
jgi:putative glutamine amidotransferase